MCAKNGAGPAFLVGKNASIDTLPSLRTGDLADALGAPCWLVWTMAHASVHRVDWRAALPESKPDRARASTVVIKVQPPSTPPSYTTSTLLRAFDRAWPSSSPPSILRCRPPCTQCALASSPRTQGPAAHDPRRDQDHICIQAPISRTPTETQSSKFGIPPRQLGVPTFIRSFGQSIDDYTYSASFFFFFRVSLRSSKVPWGREGLAGRSAVGRRVVNMQYPTKRRSM